MTMLNMGIIERVNTGGGKTFEYAHKSKNQEIDEDLEFPTKEEIEDMEEELEKDKRNWKKDERKLRKEKLAKMPRFKRILYYLGIEVH